MSQCMCVCDNADVMSDTDNDQLSTHTTQLQTELLCNGRNMHYTEVWTEHYGVKHQSQVQTS